MSKTIKAIAKELCKREGKKKQVDIAQMSEVVANLCDMAFEQFDESYYVDGLIQELLDTEQFLFAALVINGQKRYEKLLHSEIKAMRKAESPKKK